MRNGIPKEGAKTKEELVAIQFTEKLRLSQNILFIIFFIYIFTKHFLSYYIIINFEFQDKNMDR